MRGIAALYRGVVARRTLFRYRRNVTLANALEVLHALNQAWPLILLAVAWFLRRAKVREGRTRAIEHALQLAGVYVGDADRQVRELKAPDRPGVWSDEEAARVRSEVVERLTRSLPQDVLADLAGNAQSGDTVQTFLARVVEAKVTALKAATPLATRASGATN